MSTSPKRLPNPRVDLKVNELEQLYAQVEWNMGVFLDMQGFIVGVADALGVPKQRAGQYRQVQLAIRKSQAVLSRMQDVIDAAYEVEEEKGNESSRRAEGKGAGGTNGAR